ncbi:hypothetical protein RJ640_030448 [Escallonia rubra]|uniref:Uncharacterized protein n=1 Tax=Escallonia rubra TaxID=112253 RepID=A0AA88UA50_9ASTE|nr:hypothetical protein RJ640_030448 [Escallonia rubra]
MDIPASAMSQPELPPPQPAGRPQPQPPMAAPLYKQKSWSPDLYRDEAWLRRKGSQSHRPHRRSKTVTDDDLDELKACIELGFGFGLDSPDTDKHLSDTLPALGLYYAVNKQYYGSFSSSASDSDASSPLGSPHTTMFNSGDNPQTVKTRLRQWARVVACSVRQSSTG